MTNTHVDVLVVGAGLSGIGTAWHLQTYSPDRSYTILEAREAIGGTWDLFRYPGIRSDSDMYTLGYSFEPWTDRAIADGPSILKYINRVADKYGIREHIRFGHKLAAADFDSRTGRWTATVLHQGQEQRITANWLHLCTGYYHYDQAHLPDFPRLDQFTGRFFHAQFWPEDLDVSGKRVVVIGSGATAVTVVPALAQAGAAHVTMLQRSPTYMVSHPSTDRLANRLRRWLGPRRSHAAIRWRNVLLQQFFYRLSRRHPEFVKKLLRKGLAKEIASSKLIDQHFTPSYNPWDQRLCLVPDGDLFREIKNGRVDVITETIDQFTHDGLRLASGRQLQADLVVAATGLKVLLFGNVRFSIDGTPRPLSGAMSYKGLMFGGVPNLSYSFGYTNASWTLKADLTSFYLCRLLNRLRETGTAVAMPKAQAGVNEVPFLDFTSGYLQRAKDILPVQGDRAPWRLHQNYMRDLAALKYGKIDDGVMHFGKAGQDLAA